MSRIGKKVIVLPTNVTVTVDGSKVTCKGPKGELSREFNPSFKYEIDGQHLTVVRPNDTKEMRAYMVQQEHYLQIWSMVFLKDFLKNYSSMVSDIVLR